MNPVYHVHEGRHLMPGKAGTSCPGGQAPHAREGRHLMPGRAGASCPGGQQAHYNASLLKTLLRTANYLLLIVFLLTVAVAGRAQDITTMWPYAYPEFVNGTVHFADSSTLQAPVNVHLQKSRLHYLEQGHIKEAKATGMLWVEVDADTYYVRHGELFKMLAGHAQLFLASVTLADFNAIMESGGAYGSSSNVQATRKLSSVEIGGINITNHVELKSKKDAGALLPVSVKYYVVTAGDVYPATRKGIAAKLSGEREAAFKRFVKQHKIKWNNPESLKALLGFFEQE